MAGKKINGRALIWPAAAVSALVIIASVIYIFAVAGTDAGTGTGDYTLKASVTNDCTGTPWFVGQEKGFFRDAGLNFVDVGQTVTEQRGTALALGQIDVLDVDPLTLVNMVKSGVKVRAVAQSGDSSNDGDTDKEFMQWLVVNDSSLQSFASIGASNRTIRIGIGALGTAPELQTEALLDKYGVPREKAEFVVLPEQNQYQALRQGLIDVAVLHAAFYACAHAQGGVRILATSTDAFGPAGGMTLLIATERFIEEHPETMSKFITGYKNAETWCNANRAEAGAITARHLGICTGVSHYYSGTGTINVSQLQYWIDTMTDCGILSPGELKPSDLYTDQFKDVW